jgi:hypothetical protein
VKSSSYDERKRRSDARREALASGEWVSYSSSPPAAERVVEDEDEDEDETYFSMINPSEYRRG